MPILRTLRQSLRRLSREPGFTLVAVATLGLGIGLVSSVFSWIDAALFAPPPVAAPDRLVHLYTDENDADDFLRHGPVAFPDYEDLARESRTLQGTAAASLTRVALEVGGEVDLVLAEQVGGSYFEVLGVPTALGRPLASSDDRAGGPEAVVVLSHRAWQTRFGGDPGVVGTPISVNGRSFTVVGVAPEGFQGHLRGFAPQLWFPFRMGATLRTAPSMSSGNPTPGVAPMDDRGRRWHFVVGRLAEGADLATAQAEVDTIAARLRSEYPGTNEDRTFSLIPATDVRLLPGVDGILAGASAVVLGLVGLVLLIACATLANMQLVRALRRGKEMATRLALGATRRHLIGQLLVETAVLAAAGGLVGLAIAASSADLARGAGLVLPPELGIQPELDLRVVLFTLGATAFTALAFGLAPAWHATRSDGPRSKGTGSGRTRASLASTLRSEARGSTGGRSRARLRRGLVIGEVALSLVLLVCAGLSIRSLAAAQRVDPGFEVDGAVVARFAPTLQGYTDENALAFYHRLTERLEAQAGVEHVTTASHLPLTLNISSERVAGADTALEANEWPFADTAAVGPDYFRTMGISVLRGRAFTSVDREDSPGVAVVNERLASVLWPDGDAVGQTLRIDGVEGSLEVVGVVPTARYRTLGEAPRPFFYSSIAQEGDTSRTLVVRGDTDSTLLLDAIRRTARELDPKLAVTGLESLEDSLSTALLLPRVGAGLFGAFGVVGLILATLGLYGVISTSVAQRRQEIGIRMALGAGRLAIARMVAREGLLLAGVGVGVGVLAAAAGSRVLSGVLIGVGATDPITFVAVATFLLVVAVVASLVPARRAASVDPLVALRPE